MNERLRLILGALLLSIPVGIYALWIHASNQTAGYPDNVNLFNSYFPEFLRGRFTTTIISIILCALAVGLILKQLNSKHAILRAAAWLIATIGGLLGFLNLFSMM